MKRGLTVERINEVQRLIKEGFSDRAIAKALSLRRKRVSEIREKGPLAPALCVTVPVNSNQKVDHCGNQKVDHPRDKKSGCF
jgi:hypothetical protein